MLSRRDLAIALFCGLVLSALARPAFSQPSTPGLDAAAAFGAGSLDGIVGGIPPAANTYMGAFRLALGAPVRGLRVSAETELNLSGRVTGKRYVQDGPLGHYVAYREGRRDLLWSFLGGVQMWEPHHVGSVHIVAGMSRVKPLVTAEARTVATDARLDVHANYQSAWAATVGLDLLLRFGRVSAGPTYRWHDYLSNVAPYEIGRPTRAALLGLAATFHF